MMRRFARPLLIAAILLFALGGGALAVAKRLGAGYAQLDPVWTFEDAAPPTGFRIAAFPAGLAERGVPDRAILVTLDEWNDPLAVVRWSRAADDLVAVQRRLLRIDLTAETAAPLIQRLNDALRDNPDPRISRAQFSTGDRSDARALTLTGPDGLRETFEYLVNDEGLVTPVRILADGDKGALLRGGVVAMFGVVFIWIAVLCMISWAIIHIASKRIPRAPA